MLMWEKKIVTVESVCVCVYWMCLRVLKAANVPLDELWDQRYETASNYETEEESTLWWKPVKM